MGTYLSIQINAGLVTIYMYLYISKVGSGNIHYSFLETTIVLGSALD